MTELWTKKKKILTRKDRFKITEEASNKNKDDDKEKLVSEKEEQYLQLQSEQMQQYFAAQQEQQVRLHSLESICSRLSYLQESMATQQAVSENASIRSAHPEICNLNRIVPWVHERVSRWQDDADQTANPKDIVNGCLKLLRLLSDCTENCSPHVTNLANWYECKRRVRKELYKNMDSISYRVLTNIEKEMAYLNADVMYFKQVNEFFIHTIWTPVEKSRGAKDEKFPLICNLEECGVVVHLPKTFSYQVFAVRCLLFLTDYFSTDCATAAELQIPDVWRKNLLQYNQLLWQRKEVTRKQMETETNALQRERDKRNSIINKIKCLIPNSMESGKGDEINVQDEGASMGPKDLAYLSGIINLQKSYAQITLDEEKQEIQSIKEYYKVDTEKLECNMRNHQIIGGVYHLSIHKQPHQSKLLKDGTLLRMIIGNDELQEWRYSETYEPPSARTGPTKHSTDEDNEDAENTPEGALLAKLILVHMKLPDHVLWFSAPTPVHWDYAKNRWSTEYIYEVKFNEEKQSLSFRAGKMTAFGLAVFKFSNLPFQSWELKPSSAVSGTQEVTLTLSTSTLLLEFQIRAKQVCLTMLENANTPALQKLVGVIYEPSHLVRLLTTGGVNIFPAEDAFLYIDGVPLKQRVTENHLYHCMALLCTCYRFSWSRWNLMAGYKKFVLQIRELNATKGNDLLLVTDQRAMITESMDVNQTFAENATAASDAVFYPDLWSLAEQSGEKVRETVDEMETIFIETVYYMLSQTKILSYS